MSDRIVRKTPARLVMVSLGSVCVGLAVLGVLIPGLPTTIFVIAASYLFARSSPELDRKLRENRWLGPFLARFAATRGMPRRAKVVALLSMWAAITWSWFLLEPAGPLARGFAVLLGLAGTGAILFWVRTVPGGVLPAETRAGSSLNPQ